MELRIFKNKNRLEDFIKFYHKVSTATNVKVERYVGKDLWQKAFFAWCSDRYHITNFSGASEEFFGKKIYYKEEMLEFMSKCFTYKKAMEHFAPKNMIEVE